MPTATLHDRLLTDLQDLIQGLRLVGLPGVVGDPSVFVEEQDMQLTMPCILLSARGEMEDEDESSFEDDYVTYPCLATVCDVPRPTFKEAGPIYKDWRRQIARALRGLVAAPLFPNAPECFWVTVKNLETLPKELPGKLRPVSALAALCHTTEARERNG